MKETLYFLQVAAIFTATAVFLFAVFNKSFYGKKLPLLLRSVMIVLSIHAAALTTLMMSIESLKQSREIMMIFLTPYILMFFISMVNNFLSSKKSGNNNLDEGDKNRR